MNINKPDFSVSEAPTAVTPKTPSGAGRKQAFAEMLRRTEPPAKASETPASSGVTDPPPSSPAESISGAGPISAGRSGGARLDAARALTGSRLGERLQHLNLTSSLIEEVSQMIFEDPLASRKLSSIVVPSGPQLPQLPQLSDQG